MDEKKKAGQDILKQTAGGREAPLVRITCPRCGCQWETKMVQYAAKCPQLGCRYEFWLTTPGCVEVLETYD